MQQGRRRKTEERSDTLFGELLKVHLQRGGTTQKELAQESLVSEATLSRMIKGQRMSSPTTRANVIRILSVLAQKGFIHSPDDANQILKSIPTMGVLDQRNPDEAALLASLQEQQIPILSPSPAMMEEKKDVIPLPPAPPFAQRFLYPLRFKSERVRSGVLLFLLLVFALVIPSQGKFSWPTLPTQVQKAAYPGTRTPSEDLYQQITRKTPTLAESLTYQTASNWDETEDNDATCTFMKNKYTALVMKHDIVIFCVAESTHFCDLAIQIRMQILYGNGGGFFIRGTSNQHYRFLVSTRGYYQLIDQDDKFLSAGDIPGIKQNSEQEMLLTLIAQGSIFNLYMNHHLLARVTNVHTGASCGDLGMIAQSSDQPTLILFHDLRVWKL